MKTFKIIVSAICFLQSPLLFAEQIRVYCKQPAAVFERQSPEAPFSEENKIFQNVPSIIIDEKDVPPFKYKSQLKCDGNKLVLDKNFIEPNAKKKESVQKMKQTLDNELTKQNPDVVYALKLLRSIELVKAGEKPLVSE